jgi:hypothetical protein
MLTLQQILRTQSDILDNARVKIVRHKDGREEYRNAMKEKATIIEYQKKQENDVFKDCDYIISFKGIEQSRAILLGVFKVLGCESFNGKTWNYDLQLVPEFEDLADRLVIDWGNNAISWHQWYDRQPKEVIEILPKGYVGNFPGLLNFVLDFSDLKQLTSNPDANYEWRHHLSAINGVYMILDNKTGTQYVGSACGKNGIWQRWRDYAHSSGTGGNKELKALIETDPTYHRHFRFSILQTLPSNVTRDEIISIENLYKTKLGSRVHGLNRN